MADEAAWEEQLIADMRAHDGNVTSGPLAGHPLLIMISKGARSGADRRSILTYHRDGDDYIVAGTAGGSKKDPAWIFNVEAHPNVDVEVANDRFEGTATIVADGAERGRLWDDHVRALPWFADYPAQTGRIIPMIRIRRAA
ncbi:MAG TPA: nitroreductase/quinone reductase family protein [Candidatus Limnocylindrales bacterium]|nr:nitroreductase/quinone reductase family protein [Candidatus Limnocylindrales bacterium]